MYLKTFGAPHIKGMLRGLSVKRLDAALITSGLIILAILVTAPDQLSYFFQFTIEQLINTAPFIMFAVFCIGYLKAAGAESIIAKAFVGRQSRMVFITAIVGGLAPFCACEVIPFVAGMLAMGTPLSIVMAFWLSSPLIDPATFLITVSGLGWDFAIAKVIAAIGIGVFGGLITIVLARSGGFKNVLKPQRKQLCGGDTNPFHGQPEWVFWHDEKRRTIFWRESFSNASFLLKWLSVAYLIEGLMITYVPAEAIATFVGGSGFGSIFIGAVVGTPAYINGYAAVPLLSGLMQQGMSPGAAMAFIVAGSVSCIPAMTAVWVLVKPVAFFTYLTLGFIGAVISGLLFSVFA